MGKNKKSINQLKVKPIEDGARDIPTPEYLPKCPVNSIFCGTAGSGKTTSLINLLHWYKEEDLCHRLFVISPTYESNKRLYKGLPVHEDSGDVYSPDDANAIHDIQRKVEQERDDYEEYWRKKKMYDRLIDMIEKGENPPIELQLELFDPLRGDFKLPEHWLDGKCGVFHLIVDDCQQTPIYRNKAFKNINTRFRHVAPFQDLESTGRKGGSMTLSIHHCIQNFRAAQGGMPREIRGNMTCLAQFLTYNDKALEEVVEEASGHVSKEKFYELFNKATDEPKSFLLIDFKPQNENLMHRKRFDTPLT